MKVTYVTRTCRTEISRSHDQYKELDRLCFLSKNLYNAALYIERQTYFNSNTKESIINYNTLYNYMKDSNPDYLAMKNVHSKLAQNIIRHIATTMSSFKKSLLDYKRNKDKYKGEPRLPRYKHKTAGRFLLSYDYQSLSIKDNKIRAKTDIGYLEFKIPEYLEGMTLPSNKIYLDSQESNLELRQLRVIPSSLHRYIVEIIYIKKIAIPDIKSRDYPRVASIDLGVNNLATIVTNISNESPLIISGRYLKSYNKNFNKKLADLKSKAMTSNKLYTTNRIKNLYSSRTRYFSTNLHQISSYIVNYLKDKQISTLLIGYNKSWKNNSQLSKKVNQTFIQIPYRKLISLLEYKCYESGITVYLINESYTSGTSFLDNESPSQENYNIKRRIHRGIFKTNTGSLINSDVNASLQIMHKVYSKLKSSDIPGLSVFNPITIILPKVFQKSKI